MQSGTTLNLIEYLQKAFTHNQMKKNDMKSNIQTDSYTASNNYKEQTDRTQQEQRV